MHFNINSRNPTIPNLMFLLIFLIAVILVALRQCDGKNHHSVQNHPERGNEQLEGKLPSGSNGP